LPFWFHLREHTGRWRLTAKIDRNLAIASGRAEEVPFHELRHLDQDDANIVYPPTATSLKQHLCRLLGNLRLISQMLADMTSLFLMACLGLGILTIGARPRSQRTTIYWLASLGVCLLFIAAAFFVEYRMLLLPVSLLLLFAAGSLTGAGALQQDTGLMYRKVAMWLLVLASLQLALGTSLLIASPIGYPMDDITSLQAAVEQESEATGPIIGNYREPRAVALATNRACLDLPWEPLPRVLRYAAHHHASFLLLRSEDHPDLAELAWEPITTDELTPLARLEAGEGEERRVLQLQRVRVAEPIE
ncbi:MAG: hypothetical protein JXA57_05580, partial [Armatimonadetes bacterium]|nr:hypothetical protein [Armatimonadota bacterium]